MPWEEYFLRGSSQAETSGSSRSSATLALSTTLLPLLVFSETATTAIVQIATIWLFHAAVMSPTAPVSSMMRKTVMKRAGNIFFSGVASPATKKSAGKVCAHLSREDAAYTSIVDNYEAEKNSQEIFKYCLEQEILEG
jgi:hypothetical protein